MSFSVAIVGRPNVGKSTLFNRLAGQDLALVHNAPGVTRDWRDVAVKMAGEAVRLIDTAGLEERFDDSLEARMRGQTEQALEKADLVLFIVDGRSGITPLDQHFADWLRKQNLDVLLLVNKSEGRAAEAGRLDAFSLGIGEPYGIAAEHGIGLGELTLEIAERARAKGSVEDEDPDAFEITLSPDEEDEDTSNPVTYLVDLTKPIQIAVMGRPNAGKSTYLNQVLGQERLLVGPEAGITRDAIAVSFHHAGREFRAFDTAGLRRQARISDAVEKLSVRDALRALRFAQVVILLVDATLGLDKQDLTIARRAIDEGRALVLGLNKWDVVEDGEALLRDIRERVEHRVTDVRGLSILPLAALSGRNVHKLLDAAIDVHQTWSARISTSTLNQWLAMMLDEHPPPLVSGRRIKPRYMVQAKTRPPSFALFGNQVADLPKAYQRYLVNGLRRDFDLDATPIRLLLRQGANPFANKKPVSSREKRG